MENKIYKTYSELVSILRSRGMVIEYGEEELQTIKILEKENYYNIINGYKDLFLDKTSTKVAERYKEGTSFNEVYSLYNFDREIRHIYLKYLLKVENSFKTVLSHKFSALYGHDNYLKLENFYTGPSCNSILNRIAKNNKLHIQKDKNQINKLSCEENISNIIKLIGDIQQEIARQMSKHHQVVTHHMSKHGYIPFWVLVNVLTFGKITNFYKLMKPGDKVSVSKIFGVSSEELHKYMNMCSLARNKCAHDERFFDMKFRTLIHTKSIKNFDILKLEKDNSGSYVSGTNDIYAIAIMFAIILNNEDIEEFVRLMESAFLSLSNKLKTISISDVMKIMGYNKNWSNLLKLR